MGELKAKEALIFDSCTFIREAWLTSWKATALRHYPYHRVMDTSATTACRPRAGRNDRPGAADRSLSYTMGKDGITNIVSTPELNIEEDNELDPLSLGYVRGVSPGRFETDPSLYRLEVTVGIVEVSGGKRADAVLMPVSDWKQLSKLSDDIATRINIQFYLDTPDALLKALLE